MGTDGVVFKRMSEVEVLIAVITATGDEHYTEVAQLLHLLADNTCTYQIVHPIDTPTHIDNQTFMFLLGDIVHPLESVDGRLLIGTEGTEQQFCIGGYSAVCRSGPATRCNARHMCSMIVVTIDIRCIALCCNKLLLTNQFCAVVEPFRSRTGRTELVPRPQHTVMGHGSVVKRRVGIVETPIRHTYDHTVALEGLWQI